MNPKHSIHTDSPGIFLRRVTCGVLAFVSSLLFSVPVAVAGPPSHPALPSLDIPGFDHACGAAVDTEGDVYVASEGESKIRIFDPQHDELTSITNANEPCGLAVDSAGRLYVSEGATGNVVQYTPNGYPFSGTLTYGAPVTIDSSGNARGIAVDPTDDRLYVAEGNRIASFQSDGTTGQNELMLMRLETTVTVGTYTLTYEGQTTPPIPYDASSAQIQAALEALSTIGAGNITVEDGSYGVRSFLISFTHALGSKHVSSLTANSSGLSGGGIFGPGGFGSTAGFEFDGHIGEGELIDASAVAVYTNGTRRYVFAADSATDEVQVLSGPDIKSIEPATSIDGAAVPDSPSCPSCSEGFGFGPEGASIAADWGNGHLMVYDADHDVVDEFEANGRYLDQIVSSSFENAGPTAIAVRPQRSAMEEFAIGSSKTTGGSFRLSYEGAQTPPLPFRGKVSEVKASGAEVQAALEALPGIGSGNVSVFAFFQFVPKYRVRFTGALADRNVKKIAVDHSGLTPSGFVEIRQLRGSGPGRIYVSAGVGPGARLIAFGPLAAPSRAPLPALSKVAKNTLDIATDSEGYTYLVVGPQIRVLDPTGSLIATFEDPNSVNDLSVDSTGKVYVVDQGLGNPSENQLTYYTPSAYPPTGTTTYVRHEPPLLTAPTFGTAPGQIEVVAVNPDNDRVLVDGRHENTPSHILELDSASNGSTLIREFAPGFNFGPHPAGIGIHGATGNVYISPQGAGPISVVDPSGTKILASITGTDGPNGPLQAPGIAVDQSNGHVLAVSDGSSVVQEFDASGAFVGEFGELGDSRFSGRDGIAIDNSGGPNDGNAYLAYDDPAPGAFDLTAFGPLSYGEVPLAASGIANGVAGGNATVNGTVDPNLFDLSDCRFEYLSDAQYLSNGETFAGASTVPCAESLAAIGKGGDPVPVHADLSGFDPEGRYRFRLVAENKFGPSEGQAVLFGPPVITTKVPLPVLYREATLRARIDPTGLATEYHFEYGLSAGEYDHSTPSQALPSSGQPSDVQVPITGLDGGQTYHFRVVAENEARIVNGSDQTFTTLRQRPAETCPNAEFRTGLSAKLPDCRAYELVTPAETNGLFPYATSAGGSVGFSDWLVAPRGPEAGESLAYFTDGTLPGFEGNGVLDGYRARRGAGAHPPEGWDSEVFSPSYAESAPDINRHAAQLGLASDQRYSFWRLQPEESFEETLPTGYYLRTPAGFEAVGIGNLGTDLAAESRYVSAGAEHVIFVSEVQLEENAPPTGTRAVYDREAGSTSAQVVSLLPEEVTPGADATYVAATEDGTAIAFEVGGDLYLRRNGQTVQVASAPNTFAGISEDGERILYTSDADGFKPGTLYLCEAEGGSCAGSEATQEATKIADDSIFVNVSVNGSSVFFSSETVLPGVEENENGETAEAGEPNLYTWDAENESIEFVAVLDPADFKSFGESNLMELSTWTNAVGVGNGRGYSPTRSTPEGNVFVFQSHAQLTSYDNEGVGEIYRYDPSAAGARLLCISCDPSGAAPSKDALLQDFTDATAGNSETLLPNLTEDGTETFFTSADRLLPEDANDVVDVYQWQATGADGCERVAGCLALISSGQGERGSFLYSMTPDGHDVFISTREKLVGQDVAGSPSIYDARVGGGIPDRPVKAPCEGDACQGDGSIPPAISSPASATVKSQGNTSGEEGTPRRCAKGQRKVRRGRKVRCVKRQAKRQGGKGKGRAGHNRRANR